MSSVLVVELVRRAVMVALLVAGPLLLTTLIVGVAVSVVQAVTQIQEQTLTFVPKVAALAAVLVLTMPWMLRQLVRYLIETLRSVPTLVS